jgi:hypothetical protein
MAAIVRVENADRSFAREIRLRPSKSVLRSACLLAVSSFASAEVITFNRLPGNGPAIPNGFAGLDWLNFCDMNRNVPLPATALIHPAGGVPPTTAFAYNNGGAPATFSASDSLTFGSAWTAADGSSPMTVEVVGLLGGKVVDPFDCPQGPGAHTADLQLVRN